MSKASRKGGATILCTPLVAAANPTQLPPLHTHSHNSCAECSSSSLHDISLAWPVSSDQCSKCHFGERLVNTTTVTTSTGAIVEIGKCVPTSPSYADSRRARVNPHNCYSTFPLTSQPEDISTMDTFTIEEMCTSLGKKRRGVSAAHPAAVSNGTNISFFATRFARRSRGRAFYYGHPQVFHLRF